MVSDIPAVGARQCIHQTSASIVQTEQCTKMFYRLLLHFDRFRRPDLSFPSNHRQHMAGLTHALKPERTRVSLIHTSIRAVARSYVLDNIRWTAADIFLSSQDVTGDKSGWAWAVYSVQTIYKHFAERLSNLFSSEPLFISVFIYRLFTFLFSNDPYINFYNFFLFGLLSRSFSDWIRQQPAGAPYPTNRRLCVSSEQRESLLLCQHRRINLLPEEIATRKSTWTNACTAANIADSECIARHDAGPAAAANILCGGILCDRRTISRL